MRKWQRYTPEFRAEALKRLNGCENIGALARELKSREESYICGETKSRGGLELDRSRTLTKP